MIKKSSQGFTLLEALVTVSIFSLLSVVVSSIFLNVNSLQQNTASYQRLQNEGRYILEKISQEIRSREIDYPVNNPQTYLFFKKDDTGNYLLICWDGRDLRYFPTETAYVSPEEKEAACKNAGQALNASDIVVDGVRFFVWPLVEDRWGSKPLVNVQPRVTVLLKMKNNLPNNKYQKELILQTTVSSKIYKR